MFQLKALYRVMMNEADAGEAGAPAGGGEPANLLDAPVPAVDPAAPAAEPATVTAPESYTDFEVPEGFELDTEVMAEFTGLAKTLGLTQEQAQGLVGLQNKLMEKSEGARAAALEAALAEQSAQWISEIKADPIMGGAKFEQTISTAHRAVEAFATPELRALLNESGMGNNPEVVRLFASIGAAISEDKIVLPGTQEAPQKRRDADVLFGNIK